MKKIALLICSLVVVFAACKKEDKVTLRTEKITKGKWMIYASRTILTVSTNPNVYDTTDLYALLPSCQQDNLYIFNMDKSVTVDEGAAKCDPNGPQTFSGGSWMFKTADTQLEGKDTSGKVILSDIETFNDSLMVLTYKTNENNIPATTTTRYKHIN